MKSEDLVLGYFIYTVWINIEPIKGYIASAYIYDYDFTQSYEICSNKDLVIEDKYYIFGPKSIRKEI